MRMRRVRLAKGAQVVVAVHGKSGEGEFAMVGGWHSELVGEIEGVFEGLDIEPREPGDHVAGVRRTNIYNRCRRGGVRLELSMPLRERLTADGQLRTQLTERIQSCLRRATIN